MFHVFFYDLLFMATPPPSPLLPFSIGVKFSPGYTRLNFSSRGDSDRSRAISVL